MMNELNGTRFGTIRIEEEAMIHLPAGLIGFPSETRFALIRGEDERLAYLQSLTTPHLALAVIDAAVFGAGYPEPDAQALASEAGLSPGAELAVLVPVALRDGEGRLVGNQLAPIVVDSTTRRAAQVVLDPRRYSTTAPVPAALPRA
jgi:flagellar assembly factor FliW